MNRNREEERFISKKRSLQPHRISHIAKQKIPFAEKVLGSVSAEKHP